MLENSRNSSHKKEETLNVIIDVSLLVLHTCGNKLFFDPVT